MAGKAILTCRPNSHPFLERTLALEQPVKIGRSVARARAGPNNAIFDCKVLSRNHALIWYSDGKFYLQDTKSSNGTFVNNQRLSESGVESLAREVSSGDIVQFGVDVLENTRKVTHGCIVANLKLYLPDGKEAKASDTTSVPVYSNLIPVESLYELHHYLQDAIQREHVLKSKLVVLQETINNIQDSTDQGWKALIAEDSLLTRVEALENQLQIYSKASGDEKLKDDLIKLQDEKAQYQIKAKANLKKSLEEKLDAVQKWQEAKRSLGNLETQCNNLNDELTTSRAHVEDLAQSLSSQMSRNDEVETKIQELKAQHLETITKLENRNQELEQIIAKQRSQMTDFRAVKLANDATLPNVKSELALQLKLENLNDKHDETMKENKLENIERGYEYEQLKNSIEMQRKCKEVFDLIIAQKDLLMAEQHAQLQQINSLQHDYDEYSLKKQDVEEECNEVQARLDSLESQIDEKGDSKMSNGVDGSLEDQIRELKAHHHEVKTIKGSCEDNMSILKDDINAAKENFGKTSGSCLVTQEKLEKAQKDYEDSQMMTRSLTEQVKLNSLYVIENSQPIVKNSLDNEDILDLEKHILNEEQLYKLKLDEVTQSTEKGKPGLMQIDPNIAFESNKILEELHYLQEEYSNSQRQMAVMEAEINSLKDDRLRLQEANESLQAEFDSLQVIRNDGPIDKEELFLKVTSLEENLVTLATRYMRCNDERVALSHKLAASTFHYNASLNHYFTLFFSLPCFLLILALMFVSYPTISHFMGTAEHPEDQSKSD